MSQKDIIEIPFGAKDSELVGFEYTIPEGYKAEIKDGKVIVRKAENEDEKIRKWIINYLNNRILNSAIIDEKKNCLNAISWLEKQGEHANFRNKIQIGDKVTRNEDGVLVNLSQLNRVAKKDEKQGKNNMGISEATKQKLEDNLHEALEKETPESWNEFLDEQGEQKPADKVEPKFKIGDIVIVKPMSCHGKIFKGEPFKIVDIIEDNYVSDDGKTYSISLQDGWELVEQKLKWDEEDEDMLYKTIVVINRLCAEEKEYVWSISTLEKIFYWLKSLKDKVQPQPKQEWTKEDAVRFYSCLKRLGTGNPSQPETINSKWFKEHVSPQKQWKPTEEQIKALELSIVSFVPKTDPALRRPLNELLEQLKAL